MSTALEVKKDWDISIGQAMAELLKDGSLPYTTLAMDDEDVVDIPTGETALNPVEDVLAAEEHPSFGDRSSSDVGIDQLAHEWFCCDL